MRWDDVEREAPELAKAVRERFAAGKHSTLATLRSDGSPRISGTEVEFFDGGVYLGSMPGALKARDLRRDPRLALHSPTSDPPDGGVGWAGEAKLAGTAAELPTEDGTHRFELDIAEVVLTKVADDGSHLVIESWHPGRGYERRARK